MYIYVYFKSCLLIRYMTSAWLCQPVILFFNHWAYICSDQGWKLFLWEHFETLELTIEARIGRKRVVVATLLVHSVKVAIRRHNRRAIAGWGISCRGVNFVPNHADRPDSCKRGKMPVKIVGWRRNTHVAGQLHFSYQFYPPFLWKFSCKLLSVEKHVEALLKINMLSLLKHLKEEDTVFTMH